MIAIKQATYKTPANHPVSITTFFWSVFMDADKKALLRWKDKEQTRLLLTIQPDEQLRKLADEVLQAQDGCNMQGLSKSYAKALDVLSRHPSNLIGGNYVSQHPITHLWLDKLCDLAKIDRETPSKSWGNVFDLAENKEITIEVVPFSSDLPQWRSMALAWTETPV